MRSILVADDNVANRELIATILERQGYRIIEARDGAEALRLLEANAPDLMLLDIHMPVMNGFAVVDKVRADARYSKLPIVALTASAMLGDEEEALNHGFSAFIAKPYSIQDITELVKKLLEG